MTKQYTLLFIFTSFIVFSSLNYRSLKSGGAPVSKTGAPIVNTSRESTCAVSGCHSSFALNSGSGNLSIVSTDNATMYVPGQQYNFKISINHPATDKFGFQVVAIDTLTRKQIGNMILNDAIRTQIILPTQTTGNLAGRQYLTHTFDGTEALSPDASEWTFGWKAPDTAAGPVKFYLAAAAADNNAESDNDYVYSDSLLLPPPAAISEEHYEIKNYSPYPDPFIEELFINQLPASGNYSIRFFDLQGKMAHHQPIKQGKNNIDRTHLIPGIYFYTIGSGIKTLHSGKIIAQ